MAHKARPLRKVANVRFAATVHLAHKVDKLRRQARAQAERRGAMNTGSKVEVDYFALCDLIRYFDESREAAESIVKMRDLMHQKHFSIGHTR